MATIKRFEDLEIWQLARIQCSDFDKLVESTALSRDFELRNQMNASSGSVMNCIAEGFERSGNSEFKNFLLLAKGSNGEFKDIFIKEGEMFLLPPKTPHSPQRGPGTVGLVIEKKRESENDGFIWYCEKCGNKLYEETLHVDDIVKQLPPVMDRYWEDLMHRTCNKCGAVMEPPIRR